MRCSSVAAARHVASYTLASRRITDESDGTVSDAILDNTYREWLSEGAMHESNTLSEGKSPEDLEPCLRVLMEATGMSHASAACYRWEESGHTHGGGSGATAFPTFSAAMLNGPVFSDAFRCWPHPREFFEPRDDQ
jgi:hypothetical protein